MSGPPFNYADASFGITIRGDGRNDNLVLRPVTPSTFVAWSPPGALNTQSWMFRSRVTVNNTTTLVTATQIANVAPWGATYVAAVPLKSTSLSAKNYYANTNDTGVTCSPTLPIILALPSPLSNVWSLSCHIVNNVAQTEDFDILVW